MDSLSNLWQQNTDKGICRYRYVQLPLVLPKMQARNKNQCDATENGNKQMSQT